MSKNTKRLARLSNEVADFFEANRWTKSAEARNKQKQECCPRSKDAVSWCAYGAMQKCTRSDNLQNKLLNEFNNFHGETVIGFNDVRAKRKRDVVRAFRALARVLEQRGGTCKLTTSGKN